jgi:UDPglucose 6-dehydrogenase
MINTDCRYWDKKGIMIVVQKIAVVGAGYVGLVSAACFAQKGINVTVVEHDAHKIEQLLQGKIPFYEPGLLELVSHGIAHEKLHFVSSVAQACEQNPDIIFLCVGTPSMPDGSVDLSAVHTVAHEIGKHMMIPCVVVNKSTVPVGSASRVAAIISNELAARGVSISFDVVSNPEFLKEGMAIADTLYPDRIIVGSSSQAAAAKLRALYDPFITSNDQFLVMSPQSAELTKYAANAMLATRISFMNQMAELADAAGADITEIEQGMGKDGRIGSKFLKAGIGYGGSCFPKDIKALISMGIDYGCPMTLAYEVDAINNMQRLFFIKKIMARYGAQLAHKKIGIWGLSFKPDTDDIRCAPSIDVITALREQGAQLVVYDPVAMDHVRTLFGASIEYAENAQALLKAVDCLVVLTEWKQFVSTDPIDFLSVRDALVFDALNCFDPAVMAAVGIEYHCVGRNAVVPDTITAQKEHKSHSHHYCC